MLTQDRFYSCTLCPHNCGVNRFSDVGFCGISSNPVVSSIFLHRGEEPVLSGNKGVCNVFFAHCNLQCVYCQNHQISRNGLSNATWERSLGDIIDEIISFLDKGVRMLGFVSPTHQVVQMMEIIEGLHKKGHHPTIIYNTNCYDSVDVIKELEGIVDVYLPDFKYINNELGLMYSGVDNYFDVASIALREMFRQKGTTLLLGDDDLAESGLIIRHLVLPGYFSDSVELLKYLADEFSPRLHLSLMSQYYPPSGLCLNKPLDRTLSEGEYNVVLNTLEDIGFRGWVQSLDSNSHYQPDFSSDNPFS
ncbi:MAG: radical SAM protein [Bacteroidales bacterium]